LLLKSAPVVAEVNVAVNWQSGGFDWPWITRLPKKKAKRRGLMRPVYNRLEDEEKSF
jgi:hypothetical protein